MASVAASGPASRATPPAGWQRPRRRQAFRALGRGTAALQARAAAPSRARLTGWQHHSSQPPGPPAPRPILHGPDAQPPQPPRRRQQRIQPVTPAPRSWRGSTSSRPTTRRSPTTRSAPRWRTSAPRSPRTQRRRSPRRDELEHPERERRRDIRRAREKADHEATPGGPGRRPAGRLRGRARGQPAASSACARSTSS